MIKKITQFFKESWEIYKSKIKIFLGIIIAPAILIALGTFVPLVGKEPVKAFIIATILLLVAIFLWLLSILAVLCAVKYNLNIKDSYSKSFEILLPFLWVCFLMTCIAIVWLIFGSSALFLLSIRIIFTQFISTTNEEFIFSPFQTLAQMVGVETFIFFGGIALLLATFGIIFFIRFSFSIYALVSENKRGMKALFRSRQLVAGNFWSVLWRFLIFGIAATIIVFSPLFILAIAGASLFIIDIVRYFLWWALIPFALIYGFLIYKNLAEIKAETPYQEPTKKKKVGYILIIIIGTFLLLSLLALLANFIYRADDELPHKDNDLRLSKIEIPIQDNAFYDLAPYFITPFNKESFSEYWPEQKKQALREIEFKEIYWPYQEKRELIDNIIKGEEWDKEFVKYLLERNKQALNDFEKAIERSYFQEPQFQDPETIGPHTILTFFGEIRQLAKLNSVKAIHLFNQGKEKEAFEYAIKTIKAGQMLQDSPRPSMIAYLAGLSIKDMGLTILRAMLPDTSLSPDILINYTNEIGRFKLNEKGLENVLKMEYIFMINTKKMIEATMIRLNYLYKPNQIHRIIADEWVRPKIRNIYKNCGDMEAFEFMPLLFSERRNFLLTENLMGKMLLDVVLVSLSEILIRKCQEDFSVSGTQLLMALKAHQIEKGRIPLSLEELAPRYILSIPKDPFDGEPIRFSFEKKIIYSVGESLKDIGGSEGEDWKEMENPTFRIEF